MKCRRCHGNVGVCNCKPTFRETVVKRIMGNKWGIVVCIVWFMIFLAIFLFAEGFQYAQPIETTTLNTITNATGTFETQMVVTTTYYYTALEHAGMYLLYFMGALIPVWFLLAIYLNEKY